MKSVEFDRPEAPESHGVSILISVDLVAHDPVTADGADLEGAVEEHRGPRVGWPQLIMVTRESVDQRGELGRLAVEGSFVAVSGHACVIQGFK